jgi:hypothetical protein
MKTIFGLIALALFFNIGLSGCSGSSSGGPGWPQKDVQFFFNCSGVNCLNCDSRKDNPTVGERELKDTTFCYWYCGNYEGKTKRTFGIIFEKDTRTNCWGLSQVIDMGEGMCK